jgi:homeobox protein cut-like
MSFSAPRLRLPAADRSRLTSRQLYVVRANCTRVKQLEDQVTELEAEATRLLRAHDQVKEAKAEELRAVQKRADDAAREGSNQAAEIDNLRTKVKQYADYDEIKRELEIMKVSKANCTE